MADSSAASQSASRSAEGAEPSAPSQEDASNAVVATERRQEAVISHVDSDDTVANTWARGSGTAVHDVGEDVSHGGSLVAEMESSAHSSIPRGKRGGRGVLKRNSTTSEAPSHSEWDRQQAVDRLPPSTSVISQLDNVLLGQFGDITQEEVVEPDLTKTPSAGSKNQPDAGGTPEVDGPDGQRRPSRGSMKDKMDKTLGQLYSLGGGAKQNNRASAEVKTEFGQEGKTFWTKLSENQMFTSFFMTLTFYALFVPDVDLLVGSKPSKRTFSIITFAVCILFVFELVVQSLGRKKYFLRAYFWLDVIAMVSLLPDTILFQMVFQSNAFVAGRSSRLTRLIRIASRSSKATRLNRLTRIVRVASLMPRLGALLGRKVKDNDTEKMLEKKLRRVFMFLDEDMDGLIPMSAVISCLTKMKADEPVKQTKNWRVKMAQTKNLFIGSKGTKSDATGLSSPTISGITEASGKNLTPSGALDTTSAIPADELSAIRPDAKDGLKQVGARSGDFTEDAFQDRGSLARPQAKRRGVHANTGNTKDLRQLQLPSEPHQEMSIARRLKKLVTVGAVNSPPSASAFDDPDLDESEMVTFKQFRKIMLDDEWISSRLRRACQQQLKQGNNMQNLTSRHSEYIAVKVALGVLLLLFVLSMIEPAVEDYSAERGLKHLSSLVRQKYGNQTLGDTINEAVHEQVVVWTQGAGMLDEPRRILYLDLEKKVYCNEFVDPIVKPCDWNGGNHTWGTRTAIKNIDDDVFDSVFRINDLDYVAYPDLADADMSEEEFEAGTKSVVVIYSRGQTQQLAVMSILTTVLVIIIILSGIVLLTKDLTFLSRNLLRPLRELADDMESIAQLQLAGVSGAEDTIIEEGTSEVRLIRRTFENMKKAIKSWGKYVPWPVVQLLLRANIEANLEVTELEVTIFFSDIASFTSIVESMEPEQSLLLLSRYFNDMSKVIDDHGGVVLEFIGDAIQCIYGAPLVNPDHPTSAVKAALRMLAALRRMNEWSVSRNLPEVKIRCGVHTGPVLVGNMGFNMGFHSRMKYGIVGEDAHIPSRLEELNKTYSTNMLISHSTWSKIDQDTFVSRPIDFIHLRHMPSSPSELVYEVIDREKRHARAHPLWPAMSMHAEAIEEYRKQEFSRALQKFTEVADIMTEAKGEDDEASKLMMKRCKAYIEKPPKPDWEGIWDRGQEPS